MCGIVGIVTSDPTDLRSRLETMNHTLIHRGPDDAGMLVLPDDGVGLAMRRLSIIDIEGGHQPMASEDGQVLVVFNGEIYNYVGLRRELTSKGHRFRSDHSDTEVLVHGYEEWQAHLFEHLNGMFAVAIWDSRRRRLVIGRDRVGEKPLYVAALPSGFAVASELKALLCHPDVKREVDPVALEQYLAFDFVIGPRTILKRVTKLPAANYAVLTSTEMTVTRYWAPTFEPGHFRNGRGLLPELDRHLDQAVRSRMAADVPVGVFLSGGLDSTTVAYYMRKYSDEVHSLAIGFEEKAYDESHYSELAAAFLGTRHHLEVFSQDRIRDMVPHIADVLDEPMADQSIFPTFLLSKFARNWVKVALGGDGGDELFMGYKTYKALKVSWQLDRLPMVARRIVAETARRSPRQVAGHRIFGKRFAERLDAPPVARLLCSLGSYNGDSRWVLSEEVCQQLADSSVGEPLNILSEDTPELPVAEQTIAAYMRGYLQEDILVKVDRASMAASLEVRAPLLDPDLIDFLGMVPSNLKLRGWTGKYSLRQLMRGRIPDEIIDRPKKGFGVPLSAWMRSSLAPLVTDYLAPSRLRNEGYFDSAAVGNMVREHLGGSADWGQQLWPVLLFELWKERWLNKTERLQPSLA